MNIFFLLAGNDWLGDAPTISKLRWLAANLLQVRNNGMDEELLLGLVFL